MPEIDRQILSHKADFIRRAAKKHGIASFADLGGCWGVNAGYTLDLLKRHPISRAYVLDGRITQLSRDRGAQYPQLAFIQGQLGEPEVVEQVEFVDALLMLDILLHQVAPDWDNFIERWAGRARVVIIYNQMWQGELTIRFIDQGTDWYKANVHHTDSEALEAWFGRLDQIQGSSGKRWRDVHNFWQFGITQRDLINKFSTVGFRLDTFENFGSWPGNARFQNEGFVFVRRD